MRDPLDTSPASTAAPILDLSPTLRRGLKLLQKHRVLHRALGGYWTATGSAPDEAAWAANEWVGTRTVDTLLEKGYAVLQGKGRKASIFITKEGSDVRGEEAR
jgi:hypothetical protein